MKEKFNIGDTAILVNKDCTYKGIIIRVNKVILDRNFMIAREVQQCLLKIVIGKHTNFLRISNDYNSVSNNYNIISSKALLIERYSQW